MTRRTTTSKRRIRQKKLIEQRLMGVGLLVCCALRGHETNLYEENGRFFVKMKS